MTHQHSPASLSKLITFLIWPFYGLSHLLLVIIFPRNLLDACLGLVDVCLGLVDACLGLVDACLGLVDACLDLVTSIFQFCYSSFIFVCVLYLAANPDVNLSL
jgi:hypothetical protein